MQKPVDQPAGRLLRARRRIGRQDFISDRLEMAAQRHHRGDRFPLGPGLPPGDDLVLDDLPCGGGRRLAIGPALLGHPFEIVERVDEGIVEPIHRRVNVTGHTAVNDQNRLPAAALQGTLHGFGGYEVAPRAGGGDHDIGFRKRGVKITERREVVSEPARLAFGPARLAGQDDPAETGEPHLTPDQIAGVAEPDDQRDAF